MLIHSEQPDTPVIPKIPGYEERKNDTCVARSNSMHSAGSSEALLRFSSRYEVSPPLTPAISPSFLLDKYQQTPTASQHHGLGSSREQMAYYHQSPMNPPPMDPFMTSMEKSYVTTETSVDQHARPYDVAVHFDNNYLPPPPLSISNNGKRTPQGQHKHICKYPYCNWSFKR
ncbi:hypothetical protein DM01DRAFT_328347, partial [Hesseltinella vesiculosa]